MLDKHDRGRLIDQTPLIGRFKHNRLITLLARAGLSAANFRLERLIFTATTGRSGTMALARLFASITDCVGLHEPYPPMNGPMLSAASYGQTTLVDAVYARVKSINILRAALGRRVYFEANHLFIKVFMSQVFAQFGHRVAVIHLVRSPLEVATSIYRLREEPGTAVGNYWWLDHRAPTNLIQLAEALDSDREFSHPFYRALWYWYEIEMRVAALRVARPTLVFPRFETNWINDPARVRTLLTTLGVGFDEEKLSRLGTERVNVRDTQKGIGPLPSQQAQDMQAKFEELLARRGLDLSPIRRAIAA